MNDDNTLTHDERIYTQQAMREYGGSFVSALSNAWAQADQYNSARIEAAFSDYVALYGPGSLFYKNVTERSKS